MDSQSRGQGIKASLELKLELNSPDIYSKVLGSLSIQGTITIQLFHPFLLSLHLVCISGDMVARNIPTKPILKMKEIKTVTKTTKKKLCLRTHTHRNAWAKPQ